jgi:hypothetical protein
MQNFYFYTFYIFLFFIFLFFYFLGGWAQRSPYGLGSTQPAGPVTSPSQWPSWAKEEEARVK